MNPWIAERFSSGLRGIQRLAASSSAIAAYFSFSQIEWAALDR
jgi:hypothetical protein